MKKSYPKLLLFVTLLFYVVTVQAIQENYLRNVSSNAERVDKHIIQTEQERLKDVDRRFFNIGLIVIFLLFTCLIWIIINDLNQIKSINRILFRRIQSYRAFERELKRKENALSEKLLYDDETSEDDESDYLYLRLKELMKDKKNYTDRNLTRKAIALKLGTNERYLYETITKHFDMSFAEYINLLRLNYAREMIIQNIHTLDLADIALMAGFGTRQTFHRLFRDKYGISPSKFSNMLKNF